MKRRRKRIGRDSRSTILAGTDYYSLQAITSTCTAHYKCMKSSEKTQALRVDASNNISLFTNRRRGVHIK